MKQQGMILLWSLIILSVIMATCLLASHSSILQIKLTQLQTQRQIVSSAGEDLLTSLARQLPVASNCQRSQIIINKADRNNGKICHQTINNIKFAYTIALWANDPCGSLLDAPPGVQYWQITVWTTNSSSLITLMLQSTTAVAAKLPNTCKSSLRILANPKQSWRIL